MIRVLTALLLSALASADLLPASELETNCFNFPETNFNRKNCVKCTYGSSPHTAGGRSVGDQMVDFTLYDLEGTPYTLSTLLADKPVALIWGMYTCPSFEGLVGNYPFDQGGYTDEWKLIDSYKDDVTFVHLVGPEPHPITPDTNFDSGIQKMNYWSTVRQPTTYADRLTMTEKIVDYVHPSAILLPDLMTGNPYSDLNQPVWCTMGLGARTAILINQDGTMAFSQDWYRKEDFATAIDTLLASASS